MINYENLFNLKNKVALVTGAAGLLGSEFCTALCAMGASVACFDTQQESLNKLVTQLTKQYGNERAVGFVCNVADPIEVQKNVALTIKKFSKIDILLNNAATKTENSNNF